MKWDRKTRGGDGTAEEFLRANWMRLTDEEVANQLSKIVRGHVTTSAVRQKRQALGLKKTRGGVPEIFKRSTYPRHNKPKTIRANDALVISDIHAPYHDARWAWFLRGGSPILVHPRWRPPEGLG
jgi:hypothetical protein